MTRVIKQPDSTKIYLFCQAQNSVEDCGRLCKTSKDYNLGAMGGMGGTVRGKTKLEVFKKFRGSIKRKKVEDRTGLYMDAGLGAKPELYRQMKRDSETGEWVLYYHFGK